MSGWHLQCIRGRLSCVKYPENALNPTAIHIRISFVLKKCKFLFIVSLSFVYVFILDKIA